MGIKPNNRNATQKEKSNEIGLSTRIYLDLEKKLVLSLEQYTQFKKTQKQPDMKRANRRLKKTIC